MSERSRRRDDEPWDESPHEEEGPSAASSEVTRTPVTQQLGRIVVLVLLVIFVVFAISNSQRVDFSWVLGATEVEVDPGDDETTGGVPLIVLLLAAFVIGALSGAMAVRMARRRRARDLAEGER